MQRIRTRLVVAMVAVALLPAVPLALLVRELLERSFAPPFAAEAAGALEAGLEDSRARLRAEMDALADEAAGWSDGAPPRSGDRVIRTGSADVPPALDAWRRRGAAGPERVGHWIAVRPAGARDAVIARPLPAGLAQRAERSLEAIALLRALGEDRDAVLRGFVVPFLLTYALLLGVAVAVGAVLARRIARPVEALAAGATRVGAGDLDTRVDAPASGEVRRLVDAFNRMVADLAEQRDELARLERVAAWRDLARGLAHEIKNPLTPIQLAVQQLGDRYPGTGGDHGDSPDEYRVLLDECVEIVDEEVAALRRLVKEFSEFARLPEPRPEPGDLGSLIDDVARLYGEERVRRTDAGALAARFDAGELRRALINLVDNGLAACRAAGRPERVEISAAPAVGGGVRIRVADRGAGIEPENLARIFEPNFSTKSEGMGLGLALVEGIVRGHGGTVTVDSRPGEGAMFVLDLPEGVAS
jgi:nitrogen fixation/metabolism regulation signal transduction histidine kinase